MSAPAETPESVDVAAAPAPVGNPALLGLPTFLTGAISLALWLFDFLPRALPGGLIAAVVISNGIGLLLSTAWAARLGQSAVAAIFGIFGTFWISFGILVMGLVNGWWGVSAEAAVATEQVKDIQATFLISWLVVFVLLTLATLRLPLAFTVLFAFVVATVVLVLLAVLGVASSTMFTLAGVCAVIFSAVGAYLFVDGMGQELGGRAMQLGKPVMR